MADIGAIFLNQLLCELIQAIEGVTGICDLVWLESKPLNNVQNRIEVLLLLLLRIRVVVAEEADTVVVLSETEVDGNGLGVANVQVTVRLGWESCPYVLNWLLVVDFFQPAFGEYARRCGGLGGLLGRVALLFRAKRGSSSVLCLLSLSSGLLGCLLEGSLGGSQYCRSCDSSEWVTLEGPFSSPSAGGAVGFSVTSAMLSVFSLGIYRPKSLSLWRGSASLKLFDVVMDFLMFAITMAGHRWLSHVLPALVLFGSWRRRPSIRV